MRPSLPDLVNPALVGAALTEAGVRCAADGSLHLDRAWPFGDAGLSAVYTDAGGRWSVHAKSGRPSRAARAALRRGDAVALPALGAWAHRLADDPELPQLAEALDPERAAARLGGWLPGDARHCEPRVITYKPRRRCLVAYCNGALLVKMFRPGHAAGVANLYARVARTPQRGPLRIALPDGSCEAWAALLWRPAPGELLTARLGKPDAERYAEDVGRGLARLQDCGVVWEQRHDAAAELATLERWAGAATAAFPEPAAEIERSLRELATRAPQAGSEPLVPAHRDFHDGQVLVAADRISLLDLDTACSAPPELDAANFLAHIVLRRLERSASGWERMAAAFLAGHAAEAGKTALDPERLHWYEASALLRLACVYAFRPRWGELSTALVREAALRLGLVTKNRRQSR